MKTTTKSATVRARVEPQLKHDVEIILSKIGLNPTQAINLLYNQIKLNNGIPFKLKIPNNETIKAINELADDREKNKLKTFLTSEDMFEELGI